jgi:trehalose 6-phosphate phosphatase
VELLARLAQDPQRAAILLDVDGVLAPIVPRPEDARVPDDLRAELRRLAARYALVACVTGRLEANARTVVGIPELTYVGSHGLELVPGADEWVTRLAAFLETVEWPRIDNKGLTAGLHYRGVADEAAALRQLDAIAEGAHASGFRTRHGRKVLELLPPLEVHKGTAIRDLLEDRGLERALYIGDDTTDLDAFAALEGLELGVRVAVASDEAPSELRARADIVLESQTDVAGLLRRL